MLIQNVLQREALRNDDMIKAYEEKLLSLPKGTLVCRKGGYFYLKYRENGKVKDEYIGKDGAVVEDIREKLEQRKHYTEMLSVLRQEQRAIEKMLGVMV